MVFVVGVLTSPGYFNEFLPVVIFNPCVPFLCFLMLQTAVAYVDLFLSVVSILWKGIFIHDLVLLETLGETPEFVALSLFLNPI